MAKLFFGQEMEHNIKGVNQCTDTSMAGCDAPDYLLESFRSENFLQQRQKCQPARVTQGISSLSISS